MSNMQRATAIKNDDAKPFAEALDQEADELDALRVGVVRHLQAWRDAHESAVARLTDVLARMDAIVARLEHAENTGA